MSRSIPSSRALLRTGMRRASQQERIDAFLQGLREFGSKARAKRSVREDRAAVRGHRAPVASSSIPIQIVDDGPFVHYPASPRDIQNVMDLLPPGSLDGLRSVELGLGAYDQDIALEQSGASHDPHVGRVGYEVLPGVYAGATLAFYMTDRARIRVHAYVYDRERPDCRLWEPVLRAMMLTSFVHEVAHHDDRTRRVARGRWTMASKIHTERYAREREEAWVAQYVNPYVRETYREELVQLVEAVIERPDAETVLDATLNHPDRQDVARLFGQLLRGTEVLP